MSLPADSSVSPDLPVSPDTVTDSNALPAGSVAVIIPAAGSGRRFGDQQNKIFANIDGKPIWVHTVERFATRGEVGCIVVSLADKDQALLLQQMESWPLRKQPVLATGGAERFDSVASALQLIDKGDSVGGAQCSNVEYVAIHDAARPLVSKRDLDQVFAATAKHGAAILASPITGSVKRQTSRGCESVDRRDLWTALTPQVFKLDIIRHAYARHRGFPVTDDAQLVQQAGHDVQLVPGSASNIKITYPEDLTIAQSILLSEQS